MLEFLRQESVLRQPVVHDDQQALPYHLAVTPAEVLQVLAHLDATLVLSLYMYRTGFGYSSILGKGSAIAFVLILLTMALAGVLVHMMRRAREA